MSSPQDRQQCQDRNTNVWANRCVEAIHNADSRAMVSCSVYTFRAVQKPGPNGLILGSGTDKRFPARPFWLSQTNLSYWDVHQYPQGPGWSATDDLNSSEFGSIDHSRMPYLEGEFGAFKSIYGDTTSAAMAMKSQRDTVRNLGFSGWLFWTWNDTTEPLWTLLDNNGAINGLLAPGH